MRNFKSGLINCIGTAISIPILILLIIFSSFKLEALYITTFTFLASCAMLHFLFSCLHDWISNVTAKKVFQKLVNIFRILAFFSSYIVLLIMPISSKQIWLFFSFGALIITLTIIFSAIWEKIPKILLNIIYLLTYILFTIFVFILIFA